MNSVINRLPSRFPVGTRYVIEGRRAGDGDLRISLRCLEFPDGRQVQLPADKAHQATDTVARRRPRQRRPNRTVRARKGARK